MDREAGIKRRMISPRTIARTGLNTAAGGSGTPGPSHDAFTWAEKAYTHRDSDMVLRIRGHPFFEHLRGDLRYAARPSRSRGTTPLFQRG